MRQVDTITGQGSLARDFVVRDQIRRAALSITSNIAEGFERDGNKEFIQFLSIAKGSVGELKSQLYTVLDLNYVNRVEFDQLMETASEIGQLLGGLIGYLKKSRMRGTKYK